MTLRNAGTPNLLVPLNARLLSAAAIAMGMLLGIAPAGAGTRDTEAQSSTAKAPKASATEKSTPAPIFAPCKREAEGLRGPERARFMTDCLKEKKTVSP